MKAKAVTPRGAAMVEFAIVLPVFLALVLAAIDWGWYFVVQEAVANAARDGARIAAVTGNPGSGKTRAEAVLSGMIGAGAYAKLNCGAAPEALANAVKVRVTCGTAGTPLSLSGITSIPPLSWAMPAQASASVEMRSEL